jgi:hypothetical protein
MSYLARFKHDFQWSTEWIRPKRLELYPETVPLFVAPRRGAGKDDVRLSAAWTVFVQALNPDLGKYIFTPEAGWLNSNESADSLGFGGNVVRILEEPNKEWARLDCFKAQDAPPDPSVVNFQNGDPRIQKFTAISRDGRIRNAGAALDVYTVLLGRGDLYVPIERIEKFPDLPISVVINEAELRGESLRVRTRPEASAPVVMGVKRGKVDILEYAPRGANVWGRLAAGWIALLYDGRSFTSWSMETTPPVAPSGTAVVLELKSLFEKWAVKKGLSVRPKSPTEYADLETQEFWECWKAARRA